MHKIIISREKRGLGYQGVEKLLRAAIKTALKCEGVEDDCLVNVMLTDDEGIHAINLEHREVDRPTDVLSFPFNELVPGEFDPDECEYDYESEKLLLGDMVISLQRCEAQSVEYGHSFEREIFYLTVHSVLHLLGYDHLDEAEEKKQMRGREDAIMAMIGL